jgi:bifunctional non-homologous end joining protein LigD
LIFQAILKLLVKPAFISTSPPRPNKPTIKVKELAKRLANLVNERIPEFTSVERLPQKRQKKIYLDFLQNRKGQTLAAPYSVRPTPEASVSTPLHWDEVKKGLNPQKFTIKNIHQRLDKVGDLWKPVLGSGVNIPKTLKLLD